MIITVNYESDSNSDKKYRITAMQDDKSYSMKFDHYPTIEEIQAEVDFTKARMLELEQNIA